MEKNGKKSTSNYISGYGKKTLIDKKEEESVKSNLSFSFSFFKQIRYFGIGKCSIEWWIGLINRLKTLGDCSKETFIENRGSEALRYHVIDWKSKNIPIQRKSLEWLPENILNNEADYPMVQISISTSTGRIIGFFDNSIFNIVLLDPNHNLQPSKKTNYQIQPTKIGISQYDKLLNKLDNIKNIVRECPINCNLKNNISTIDKLHDNIIYFGLDEDFYSKYLEEINTYKIQKIIEIGIIDLDSK